MSEPAITYEVRDSNGGSVEFDTLAAALDYAEAIYARTPELPQMAERLKVVRLTRVLLETIYRPEL